MELTTTLNRESARSPQRPRRLRWGPWATLAWGISLAATAVLSQTMGAFGFVMFRRLLDPDHPVAIRDLMSNGPALAFSLAVSAPIVIGALALVVRLSRIPIREYLGLKWPRWRQIGIGATALFAVLLGTGIIAAMMGLEQPDFIADTYNSAKMAGMLPLLILSFVFLGPLQEELLFRGFFFRGFMPTLGAWPTIILTSAIWALTHAQYQWFFVGEIFALGLVFGWLRWRYGSTILTFILHAAVNGLALLEIALVAGS